MSKNTALYDLLGVEPTATEDEIRKGYRKMALKYHPDKNRDNPDAQKMFIRIKEAYDILSDPRKRSMYDSMGETSVKMMDDPTSITPEMFTSMIHQAPTSLRRQIISIVVLVVFLFIWFSITLLLRIDSILTWKWWIIMIPIYLVDLFIFYNLIMSIPILFAKYKYNKTIDKEAQDPVYPDVLTMFNTLLLLIAQFTYIFRLDGILKCSYTTSLLPFFIYSFKLLYMPVIYYKLRQMEKKDMYMDMLSFIYPITILFVCLKVDGFVNCQWSTTFVFIWIYFAFLAIMDCFAIYCFKFSNNMNEDMLIRNHYRRDLCGIVVKVLIYVAVLNKLSGVWKWRISYIGIPIIAIIGLFACCFICSMYALLFGNMDMDFVQAQMNQTEMETPINTEEQSYMGVNVDLNKQEGTVVDMDLGMD